MPGQFNTPSVSYDPLEAQSLVFGDIDEDGDNDACVRRSDGIWCATNSGSGDFDSWTRWTTNFSDAQGWNVASYARTIRMGDIDGDGDADICGRFSTGVVCALSNGSTGFTSYAQWSSAFSDSAGYNTASRYLSFGLADIDGNGDTDACIRRARSVRRSGPTRYGSPESSPTP